MLKKSIFVLMYLLAEPYMAKAEMVPSIDLSSLANTSPVVVTAVLDSEPSRVAGEVTLNVEEVIKGTSHVKPGRLYATWPGGRIFARKGTRSVWFLNLDSTGKFKLSAGAPFVVVGDGNVGSISVLGRIAQKLGSTIAADDSRICAAGGVNTPNADYAKARRLEAFNVLRRLPKREALNVVQTLSTHSSRDVMLLSLAGQFHLGQASDFTTAIPNLLRPDARNPEYARALMDAISALPPSPGIRDSAISLLDSSDEYIMRAALDLLRETASRQDVQRLQGFLYNQDERVRYSAADAISRILGQERVDFSSYLKNEDQLRAKLLSLKEHG